MLNFPEMFPSDVCFENTERKIDHGARLKGKWSKLTQFMPVLALITSVMSSVHGTFCGGWKRGFLK